VSSLELTFDRAPRFVLLLVLIVTELMLSPLFVAWLMGASRDPGAALAYFSFITLTTVGYGDITPVWPGAGVLQRPRRSSANSISR
jgi:Ion channel